MDDPDYPPEAVNSNIIVEEIEMNGRIQKIFKKTYYLIDGKTINITRMEQAWSSKLHLGIIDQTFKWLEVFLLTTSSDDKATT